MKFIVIFAMLALALCQNPLYDAITGFTTQLSLTEDQIQKTNKCLGGLLAEIESAQLLYMDILAEDLPAFMNDAALLIQNFKPVMQAACEPIIGDLRFYALAFGNGQKAQANLGMNSAYVAQQLAVIMQTVSEKNFTGFGQTAGYMFQIAIGMIDLEPIVPQPLTLEQIQTLSQNYNTLFADEAATTEYLNAFVTELGVAELVNVTAMVKLVGAFKQVVPAIMNLQQQLMQGDFDGSIAAIQEFTIFALELIRNNREGLESIVAVEAPLFKAFLRSPLKFFGVTMYNALMNAPKSVQLNNQLTNDLIAANFAAVGKDAADTVKMYYSQVYGN